MRRTWCFFGHFRECLRRSNVHYVRTRRKTRRLARNQGPNSHGGAASFAAAAVDFVAVVAAVPAAVGVVVVP